MSWSDLKRKYNGVELSEFMIIEYIAVGSYQEVGKKYNVSKDFISTSIKANLQHVKEEKPYLYELYKYKTEYNRKNGAKLAKKRPKKYNTYGSECEELKPLTSKVLQTLPAQMVYKEFLDLMLRYNTGDRTGDDLVKMAAKYGTRVYRLRNNGSKKFIV